MSIKESAVFISKLDQGLWQVVPACCPVTALGIGSLLARSGDVYCPMCRGVSDPAAAEMLRHIHTLFV